MEDNVKLGEQELDDADDALSLCDLLIHGNDSDCDDNWAEHSNPTSDQELFQFNTDVSSQIFANDNIIFCGKLMTEKQPFPDKFDVSRGIAQQTENYVRWRSESFHKSRVSQFYAPEKQFALRKRSDSVRSPATEKPRFATGEILQRGSNGGRSRGHIFSFGLAKLPTKMELSDIRKRQCRLIPAPLTPEPDVGVSLAGGRGSGHCRLIRPLKCRSHVLSALARTSFGCISH